MYLKCGCINIGQSLRCSDYYVSVLVLCYRSYRMGSDALYPSVNLGLVKIEHGYAVLVCSDPYPVVFIHIEGKNRGYPRSRIIAVE